MAISLLLRYHIRHKHQGHGGLLSNSVSPCFPRFACDAGYPKTLIVDEGSQIVKGCETMKIQFWDLKFQLHRDVGMDFEVVPVGGHNFNGKVERKIREIKKSMSKTMSNLRLSLMQWETLAATVANVGLFQ